MLRNVALKQSTVLLRNHGVLGETHGASVICKLFGWGHSLLASVSRDVASAELTHVAMNSTMHAVQVKVQVIEDMQQSLLQA